jgi:hypothetical protein
MEALAIWWKPFGSTLRIITLKARISANPLQRKANHAKAKTSDRSAHE